MSTFLRKSKLSISILICLLSIWGCSNNPAAPTTGTIQGQVTNASGGALVVGASISTTPPTSAVSTDAQGKYTIDGVSPGQYTVVASKTGYNPDSVTISVTAGKTTTADIYLIGTPLSAPTIASATPGDSSVTVGWNAVSGATSYNLYYAAGTTVSSTSGTKVTGVVSPKQIVGLTNGTQYAFAVTAVNAAGESGLSNVLTATPQAGGGNPLAPKILVSDTLFAGTKGSVTVTLKDTNLTDTVVNVKVTSTADMVGIMLKLTGKNGTYTGQLAFSTIVSSGNAIQVGSNCLVSITYKDMISGLSRTQNLLWKGGALGVALDNTSYQGVSHPMVVMVTDTNVSSPTVSATITTSTFATPVTITLKLVPGTYGLYTDTVYFMVGNAVTLKDTIRVHNNDSVTVAFSDPVVPGSTVMKSAQWKGSPITVALDNTSYEGISSPMIITVTDPNVLSQTITVNVMSTSYSTAFPVTLTLSASISGQYIGNVHFSVSTAMTIKDTVHVKDGDTITVSYTNPAVLNSAATQKAQWTAIRPILVGASASIWMGLKDKMTINVTDHNVTTRTVTVHLSSHKDPTGIDVALLPNLSVESEYSGQVSASLTQSVAGSVIAVQPLLDTLTLSYTDPAISTPIAGQHLQWQATSVSILTDSGSYHGTTGGMSIYLTNDHTNAASLIVNVISKKAGDTIPVTLTAVPVTPWIFTGLVGFTLGTKTATMVSVRDSDQVTVLYFDNIMTETKSISVGWYSQQKIVLGLFGSSVTPASIINNAISPALLIWAGTVSVDSLDSVGVNGSSKGLAVTTIGAGGWAGFGLEQMVGGVVTGIDMTKYMATCTLHVAIKGNSPDLGLLIDNVNPGPNPALQTWISAVANGYLPDGQWHVLNIPLSQWSIAGSGACDFTNVSIFLGVRFNNPTYVAGSYVVLDDVYWTLPN